jgi:hypothetical protein
MKVTLSGSIDTLAGHIICFARLKNTKWRLALAELTLLMIMYLIITDEMLCHFVDALNSHGAIK